MKKTQTPDQIQNPNTKPKAQAPNQTQNTKQKPKHQTK